MSVVKDLNGNIIPTSPASALVTDVDGKVVYSPVDASVVQASTKVGIYDPNIKRKFHKPGANASSGKDGILRYPSHPHSIDPNTDYVLFEFFKYRPPFGRGEGEELFGQPLNLTGYDLYQSSQERSYQAKTLEPIIMYMPEDIQAQYTAKWGGAGFGAATAGLARLVGTQAGAIPTIPDTAAGMLKTATYDTILKGINAFTGSSISSVDQLLGGVSGTIINPNVEMMYQAPDLRNLSFKFKMTPKSEKEANSIRGICNRFKKAMLPTFGGQSIFGTMKDAPNLITIPNLCQVTYMNGSKPHPYLPRYKLCAITGVDINYTPDGAYATYEGGSPVATEIAISLVETKVIFANEIEENSIDNY